jgi:preprotein translocase subunit SecG
MLRIFLTGVQLFSAVIIIALVLLQRGRGADAGAGFGAGASGTVFGARGATTGLSRATAIAAIIFMINSLVLAYTGKQEVAAPKPLLEVPATTLPAATVPATTVPALPLVVSPAPAAATTPAAPEKK